MTTDTDSNAPGRLILIDGSGYIFRAFFALPPMNRADGTPVNAVFGFTNILSRFLRDHASTHIAVIFDSERKTFRNEIYDAYKAHRPEPPPELIPQFALVRDATRAFGVAAIEAPGFEADDLIAAYARAATNVGLTVSIVSSDKDLMQLIRPGVTMLDPIKQKPLGEPEVFDKFGVPPSKVVDVQALMGDSTDNVPGVPGIGPKGAAELITTYGDLEAVLAAAPSMKPSKRRDNLIQHAELARISKKLVQLAEDAPLPLKLEELTAQPLPRETLSAWLLSQGFKSTLVRLGLGQGTETTPETPPQNHTATGFGPYRAILTTEDLKTFLGAAELAHKIALTVHTDAEPRAWRATIAGVALSCHPGDAVYIPLAGNGLMADCMKVADFLALLSPILMNPAILKIIPNAKHALLVLAYAGAPEAQAVDDVLMISYVQGAGAHAHTLAELSPMHLGHTPKSSDDVTGTGRARLAFADAPVSAATAYAGEAADITLRLWQILKPNLRTNKALALYEQMERPLLPILMEAEREGILIDIAELKKLSGEFAERMAQYDSRAASFANKPFNISSPKQLGEILFDQLKLPGGKRTATGAWGTDASMLQTLAEQGHELPEIILAWRQLAKLKSTYTDALVEEINPRTGRVHTSFAMTITSTGRLSSNDPNLQNIPVRNEEGGRIRRAFIASPGHVLVSADYSQIELRLLAHVADIPSLKKAFIDGEDIHARTASEVFGVTMEAMDKETRRRAKAINFGIIYGISGFGLARQLGIEPGEARAYIETYFKRYPGIKDFMERTKEEAKTNGYVLTPFGRRCYIAGIADRNGARRAGAERQAINAPLQGGAADVIKRAMVHLAPKLKKSDLAAKLLLQVHDELLFEVREDHAKDLATLAKQEMEQVATLSVPLTVETGIGRNWGDAH
jgi:DNA polymerase-1